MKLLTNYNRIGLWFMVTAVLITGVLYYFTISYILSGQVDKDLRTEEKEIVDYVRLNRNLPKVFDLEDLKIRFTPVVQPVKRRFSDISFFNQREHEYEAGRQLTTAIAVNGVYYKIEIIESKVETDDLVRLIFEVTLAIIFILLLGLFFINRYAVGSLWQPFYAMLQQITLFNLADQNNIDKIDTEIDEFKAMNDEITAMSQRVLRDYKELRSFTENAAHELMTPLSVIGFKLDNLVQEGLVSEKQGTLVEEIYHTLNRMKKMNRAMLMLARIENKLFQIRESIDLANAVAETIKQFEEIFAQLHITIEYNLQPSSIAINRDLLPILLNNLFANAVNHNHTDGRILVFCSNGNLSIANTGAKVPLEKEAIFQRFYKTAGSQGTGLGLTLIQGICEACDIEISYHFKNSMHQFELHF